ncbi:MAG TPA: hypothetical protein VFA20_01615 [Myxococcaceae bacterium]|nr:hypothetical protein [Myxococcaceae bacterium]
MRLLVLFACCALSAGCAFGNVREKEIGALGPYRDMPVRALSVGGPDVPQEVSNELQAGLNRGLESWNKEHAPPGPLTPETVLEVQPELLDVHVAKAGASTTSPVAAAASQIGLAGAVESNRISLLLLLHAPGVSDPIGELHWEGAGGSLSEVASQAGVGSAEALVKEMKERRDQWVTRRAGDERYLLTPSARLLDPGEFVLSDDELLLFHLGAGITRWLQVDLGLGGLPLPAAGAIPIVGHGVGAAGGAGILVLGAVDVGFRIRVLEEGQYWPGIAVGYDMMDAFAAGLGGAGIFFAGNGIGAIAGGAVLGVNVQLNIFTAMANKRVGAFDFGAGAAIFDNHHFLPQSAGFAAGIPLVAVDTSVKDLDRMPTVVVPFVSVEATPWEWLHFIQEVLPQQPVANSFGSTTIRIVWGPSALSPLRLKLDLAIIEAFGNEGLVPLPWASAGVYWL